MPKVSPSALKTLTPLLFVFLWSTGFVGAKFGLPYASPLSFLFVRYLLVIGLMLAIALALRAAWPRDLQQWIHIGISGILIHGIYLGGVFTAIGHGMPAGVASLIVGLQPILTAIGAGLWLGDKVTRWQWLGLVMGLTGATMVLSGKLGWAPAVDALPLAPMLIPIFTALGGITVGTLYQKKFCPRFDLRSGAVIQFAPAALLTFLCLGIWEEFHVEWTGEFVFALLWLVFVLSIGAISLLNVLIRSGSAVNVASLFFLTPPSTALIAWAMFGETITGIALAGMVLAVAGVYLSRR